MKQLMIILTDSLGVLLIIAAPLLGWLPGPGGVPMLLAGLSLLALNHDWAQKLIDELKKHAGSFTKRVLNKVPVATLLFWGMFITVSTIGVVVLLFIDSPGQYLGLVYLLVAALLIIMRKEKA